MPDIGSFESNFARRVSMHLDLKALKNLFWVNLFIKCYKIRAFQNSPYLLFFKIMFDLNSQRVFLASGHKCRILTNLRTCQPGDISINFRKFWCFLPLRSQIELEKNANLMFDQSDLLLFWRKNRRGQIYRVWRSQRSFKTTFPKFCSHDFLIIINELFQTF